MKKINLNLDWKFSRACRPMDFAPKQESYEKIDLPHDFIVTMPRKPDALGGAPNGFFGEGSATYVKEFEAPDAWLDKRVILDIDGAYMNAEVKHNRKLLAMHPYGYTPYLVDLTDTMQAGTNKLQIITQSHQPSSRWYSGGGIYRSVSLWVGEKIGIKPWDLFITTPVAEKDRAVVNANITVTSIAEKAQPFTVKTVIKSACGCTVIAEGEDIGVARPGQETVLDIQMEVKDPIRWDLDDPYLYLMETTVIAEGQEPEVTETKFGIRKIQVDSEYGFRLNDKVVKLKGGCIHHDHGFLGAAAFPRAEERKIQILKNAGYNAVRISHYPPSLAMLEVCDREGILLLDEAFDCWRRGKVAMDYHLYFENWWERDITYMVMRDRNHPCVLTYSIGNEIGERDGSNDGYAWAHKLADKIRSLDNTRFVTSAINSIREPNEETNMSNYDSNKRVYGGTYWSEKSACFADALDIVGYNYIWPRYASDHERFPKRVMMGTETHPFTIYKYWTETMKWPWVIGDFVWTAYDNLGEAGVGRVIWEDSDEQRGFLGSYPWRTCFQGDMDLCGYRTGQSYYREILWKHANDPVLYTTHPSHYGKEFWGTGWHWYDVEDTWTFEDAWIGKPVKVDVYCDADEAEFFLNGEPQGKATFEELIASCDIPYAPGTVEAVVYKEGTEIGRCSLTTTGAAAAVTAKADRPEITADRQDLSFIELTIVDSEGRRVVAEDSRINIEVTGAGHLAGIGNANPCTEENYGTPYCKAWEGRALAAVIADEPGEIKVTVTVDGLKSAEITVVGE